MCSQYDVWSLTRTWFSIYWFELKRKRRNITKSLDLAWMKYEYMNDYNSFLVVPLFEKLYRVYDIQIFQLHFHPMTYVHDMTCCWGESFRENGKKNPIVGMSEMDAIWKQKTSSNALLKIELISAKLCYPVSSFDWIIQWLNNMWQVQCGFNWLLVMLDVDMHTYVLWVFKYITIYMTRTYIIEFLTTILLINYNFVCSPLTHHHFRIISNYPLVFIAILSEG